MEKNAAGAQLYWDNRSLLFFTLYFKIDSLRAVFRNIKENFRGSIKQWQP